MNLCGLGLAALLKGFRHMKLCMPRFGCLVQKALGA